MEHLAHMLEMDKVNMDLLMDQPDQRVLHRLVQQNRLSQLLHRQQLRLV